LLRVKDRKLWILDEAKEENETLTAIDKCLLRVLNTNVKFLKTYEMIGESKMLYGIEIWTFKGGWKYTDGIQGGFFKKVVRNPRSTGNVAAEWGLGSEFRKGKMLLSIVNSVTGIF
jgi:hypothetical protein